MRYVVFFSAALGALLLYLLSQASANTAASGDYYTVLLGLNIALAVGLMILIAFQLWRLFRQIKEKVIGSRLTIRLLGAFALMAVIPGLMVYAVSVNFLTRAIESWFNVKVEAALEGGLRLGQSALDIMLSDVKKKADNMALGLAFQPSTLQLTILNDLREKSGVEDAALLSTQGRILAFSSSDPASFIPELPSIPQLRQARQQVYGVIEPILGKGLYLRVLAPVSMSDYSAEPRVLQLLQPVPKALANTAESVQEVYQDYQELSLSRQSLKEVFALTLTLVLMLAMLSAISIAFVLSRRLSAPLGVLAEGTSAIARGDYSQVLPVHGHDELGVLVQSFNSMTSQLGEATQAANRNRARVEAARGYLETILAHLSSGVLALNERGELRTYNVAASNIIGVNLGHYADKPFALVSVDVPALKPFVSKVTEQFAVHQLQGWQLQMEIVTAQGNRTVLLQGSRLPYSADSGFLVVFDDITAMVQAQRDAAWGEVARRLAHEIKNPLTPIQLSAERLEHKLSSKLEGADAAMLKRATETIVAQVDAMKTMVNEFSEYARAPALSLSEVDINRLTEDVLAMYESFGASIQSHLAKKLPKVMGDTSMLRQVLHNLLQNAHDALDGKAQGQVQIHTHAEAGQVVITVSDNGDGFPPEIITRAFEPYMTTKRHGTGLGLPIVKKIIEEHQGHIHLENMTEAEGGGARVVVTLPAVVTKTQSSSSGKKVLDRTRENIK
jgi:nitrogen fixation/metabolism regulation signal transduction histidine kinase